MFFVNCSVRRQIVKILLKSGKTESRRTAGDSVHNGRTGGVKLFPQHFMREIKSFIALPSGMTFFVVERREKDSQFCWEEKRPVKSRNKKHSEWQTEQMNHFIWSNLYHCLVQPLCHKSRDHKQCSGVQKRHSRLKFHLPPIIVGCNFATIQTFPGGNKLCRWLSCQSNFSNLREIKVSAVQWTSCSCQFKEQ